MWLPYSPPLKGGRIMTKVETAFLHRAARPLPSFFWKNEEKGLRCPEHRLFKAQKSCPQLSWVRFRYGNRADAMGILQMPNFHMCRCPKKGLFFVFFGHRANSLEGHERIGGLRIHLRYTAALSLPWANSLEGHERIGGHRLFKAHGVFFGRM